MRLPQFVMSSCVKDGDATKVLHAFAGDEKNRTFTASLWLWIYNEKRQIDRGIPIGVSGV
jgi:hypothetical protein